jgi:hypothetical protein
MGGGLAPVSLLTALAHKPAATVLLLLPLSWLRPDSLHAPSSTITASLDGCSPSRIILARASSPGSADLLLGLATAGSPGVRIALAARSVGATACGLSIKLWSTGARLIGTVRSQAAFALAPFIGALVAWPVNGEHADGAVGSPHDAALSRRTRPRVQPPARHPTTPTALSPGQAVVSGRSVDQTLTDDCA